jgi:hypothetical protein
MDIEAAKILTSMRASDEIDAANNLLLMKKGEINALEAAALTILDLNRIPVSDDLLKKELQKTSFEVVQNNASLFAYYGIIPEVEIVDVDGGAKRGREEDNPEPDGPSREGEIQSPTDRSQRDRKLTKKMIDYKSPPPKSQGALIKEARAAKALTLAEFRQKISTVNVAKKFEGVQYEELDEYLKGLDVCHPKMASQFMRALFPTKAVSIWTEVMGKQCRDIYEPGSVEAQCLNTIDKYRLQDITTETGDILKKDICYICGFDFNMDIDGLKPTCEHILPIIQAIFFLDLYRPLEKRKHTNEQMDILKKEYAWAHRCCNYVKGDNSFLVTKLNKQTNFPKWEFGINQTTRVLSGINDTRKYAGTEILQGLIAAKGYDIWLKERLKYIDEEKVSNIVKYIDSKGMGGTVIMIGFGNCVDSTKLNDKFKEILHAIENNLSLETFESKSKKQRRNTIGGKNFTYRNNVKSIRSSSGSGKKSGNRKTARINRTE